jgi:hypothetical protein
MEDLLSEVGLSFAPVVFPCNTSAIRGKLPRLPTLSDYDSLLKEHDRVSVATLLPLSQAELEHQVQARTGRRVRDLSIELAAERIVLKGHVSSYYLKQLAQHGVHDLLPQIHVTNEIVVA